MRMFGLELFLSRCQKLKVGLTASKIGRLHRTFDAKTKVIFHQKQTTKVHRCFLDFDN